MILTLIWRGPSELLSIYACTFSTLHEFPANYQLPLLYGFAVITNQWVMQWISYSYLSLNFLFFGIKYLNTGFRVPKNSIT